MASAAIDVKAKLVGFLPITESSIAAPMITVPANSKRIPSQQFAEEMIKYARWFTSSSSLFFSINRFCAS